MSKTKYLLVEREGYNPTAMAPEALEVCKAYPQYHGEVILSKPVTLREVKRLKLRIVETAWLKDYTAELQFRDHYHNRTFKAEVMWFDKSSGVGAVKDLDNGVRHTLYACNVKGKKTWYPETACVYVMAGDIIDVKLDSGLAVCLTQGIIDEDKWSSLDQSKLAFKCDETGKAISGLFA